MSAPPAKSRRRRSSVIEAHAIYDKYHRHRKAVVVVEEVVEDDGGDDEEDHHGAAGKQVKPVLVADDENIQASAMAELFPQFHRVEKTGVIYATTRALRHGFHPDDPEWSNMGQGAPETGPLPGAPPRSMTFTIPNEELEYAPVTGIQELRVKVADYYNHLYRKGHTSQYTSENICIIPGGRAGLTRIMAVLGNTQVGYFTPEYTAYEQALGLFLRTTPSALLHRNINEAIMNPEDFAFEINGRGVGAMLLSNPANPTGQSIEGKNLEAYVEIAREQDCAIIMDEFYSHYYYDGDAVDPEDGGADDDSNWPKTVSSAAYVQDVNVDPILIVNGLTKNWRCPSFRVCWIVAPAQIVKMLGSAGSYLDGGANGPLQSLSLPMMELDFIRRDAWALQRHFRKKRDYLLTALTGMGIRVQWVPTATFYIWADLSGLLPPLNDCLVFLEECVRHKVIIVPGVFFDINPRGTRNVRTSKCNANVRFSYGPPMENLVLGMKQIAGMVREWKMHTKSASLYNAESL